MPRHGDSKVLWLGRVERRPIFMSRVDICIDSFNYNFNSISTVFMILFMIYMLITLVICCSQIMCLDAAPQKALQLYNALLKSS